MDALPGWYPKSELRTRTVSPAACLDTIWNLKRVGVRAVITRVKRRRFVGQRDDNRARATRSREPTPYDRRDLPIGVAQ